MLFVIRIKMWSRFEIIFICLLFSRKVNSLQIEPKSLIKDIFFKDNIKSIIYVIENGTDIPLNTEVPYKVLSFHHFSILCENLQQDKINLLTIIVNNRPTCSGKMWLFKKVLIIIHSNNTQLFTLGNCVNGLRRGLILYNFEESKFFELLDFFVSPVRGSSRKEIIYPQNKYYPYIQNIQHSYIQIDVEEFIFPVLFKYSDKFSQGQVKLGGFLFHMIKAFAESIRGQLIFIVKEFKYFLDKNNVVRQITSSIFIDRTHQFPIQSYLENELYFIEYFSNELVYPLTTESGIKFIYGKVFDIASWIGILLFWIWFVFLCTINYRKSFSSSIFDGLKYFLNQDVRIYRENYLTYKVFLLSAFLINTIYLNLIGSYSKISYFDGSKDLRIKVVKIKDSNDLIYSADIYQNYLSKNAYILEPMQLEAFNEIQKFTNNFNFKHEKVLLKKNTSKAFLPLGSKFSMVIDEVYNHVLKSYSSGLIQKWKQEVAFEYFRGNLKNYEIEKVNLHASFDEETLENLLIPFTVIFGGCLIAFVVFYVEILMALKNLVLNIISIVFLLITVFYVSFKGNDLIESLFL